MGRSRGGLTTKLHLLAEGRGRALARRLTGGQAADTKELVALLDAVAVPRPVGVGRHRKRLDHLTTDKAYGSKANRRSLRERGIAHTIPERDAAGCAGTPTLAMSTSSTRPPRTRPCSCGTR
ncbi:transposase [Catellatospora chokoriensis]|uniref:transposase n=1 Tax=Catellatospora chokoriensis TaxID=310353 RepID=UPI0035711AB6